MVTTPLKSDGARADAFDVARLDEFGRLAELAASYWRSVALAADRGDALTVTVHCRQIAAVTREAFAVAKSPRREEEP